MSGGAAVIVAPGGYLRALEGRRRRRGFLFWMVALGLLVAACGDPSVAGGAPAENVTTVARGPVHVSTTSATGPSTEFVGGGSQDDVTVTTQTDDVMCSSSPNCGPLGFGEGVNYLSPEGLSRVEIVEALGGRLQEGLPPIYPPFYVAECWDVYQGVYVLYVTDPSGVDLELLEPHLHGAPLRLVTSAYSRDQLNAWWDQILVGITRDALVVDANNTLIDPGFPESGAFCSQTGYYFDIVLYPESHDADLTQIFAGITSDLIRLTISKLPPGPMFP
jgi:hypothetical protein